MKRFKFKSVISALAALVLAVPMACAPAFAFTNCPPFEEGVTSTGIHCVSERSVLEVKSEVLTFNIGTPYYELKEDEKYNTTVTAEYTFYNPTVETIKTKMAFPVREVPYYAENNEKVNRVENPITVDGQPVNYTTRHTYGTYNSFEEDAKKIRDTYYETDFFKTDLPVTEYVFKANLEDSNSATFKVKMPSNEGTRYFGNSDGQGNFYYSLHNGEKFSIFILGNDLDLSDLNWSITRFSSLLGRDIQVNGSVTLEKKMDSTTFKSYVLQGYDSKSEVSEVDYYNAMFDLMYTDGVWAGHGITPAGYNFTEWYVYETSVAPGGTFKNAVTANLYPTVYYSYNPYIYEYNYFLSPAREWASFGSVTVNINTTQYLQKGDYYDPDDAEKSKFQKTETGYSATFDSLPSKELSFKTCVAQTPAISEEHVGTQFPVWLVIILSVFFIGGPLIVGVTMLIIFLVQNKKKEKKAKTFSTSPDQAPEPDTPVSSDIDDGTDGADAANGQAKDESISCEGESSQAVENSEQHFCVYCGSKLESGVKFCSNCGGPVQSDKPVNGSPVQCGNYSRQGYKRLNGFGIAGFVLSLIAVLALSSPVCILLVGAAFGLSLAGVILRKKYQGVYGLAIAGLVISSYILAIILLLALLDIIGLLCWGGMC